MKNKLILLILLVITIFSLQSVNAQIISTFAGNGTSGFSGDGGPSTNANLYYPRSVAVDASGNVYIADAGNGLVRKVNRFGIISTIAGGGASIADGIAATSAIIYPQCIAVDNAGNVYFCDENYYRIRKINSAGIISTIAGTGFPGYSGDNGPATDAQIGNPECNCFDNICIDGSGNIYFNEINRIRKINTSGIISTFAGNGENGLTMGGPATATPIGAEGFAVDQWGNGYFTEGGFIYKVYAISGQIENIAGNGEYGYSGDGGDVYFAALGLPTAITADGAGNIYFVSANCIRKIDIYNTIPTVAGIPTDGSGDYNGDGQAATDATLNAPTGVTVDNHGNIFIADLFNWRIRVVSTSSFVFGASSTLHAGSAIPSVPVATPGLWFSIALSGGSMSSGMSYQWQLSPNATDWLNISGATSSTYSTTQSVSMYYRCYVSSGSSGESDTSSGVFVFSPGASPNINTFAGNNSAGYTGDGGIVYSSQLNLPSSIVTDATGNTYIADVGNNVVLTDNLGDIPSSIRHLRERMFSENEFAAAVFIGGMDGIEVEYNMFKEYHPKALLLPIASTGAATKIVYDNDFPEDLKNERLVKDYGYMSLFQKMLIDKI